MEQVLNKREIVIVPLRFSDQTNVKTRPALIISSNGYNQKSDDVIVCAITSNVGFWKYEVLIKPEDWKEGNYSESCVKVDSIFTVDKKIVSKRIGRLCAERFDEVMKKFYGIFEREKVN